MAETSLYFKITPAQKDLWQAHLDEENRFQARQTTIGDWVCDVSSLYEFADLFDGQIVSIVELAPSDFPIPTF